MVKEHKVSIAILINRQNDSNPSNDNHTNAKIRQSRYDHSLSQESFAQLIGVDPSAVTRIETNHCTSKSKALQRALKYINVYKR